MQNFSFIVGYKFLKRSQLSSASLGTYSKGDVWMKYGGWLFKPLGYIGGPDSRSDRGPRVPNWRRVVLQSKLSRGMEMGWFRSSDSFPADYGMLYGAWGVESRALDVEGLCIEDGVQQDFFSLFFSTSVFTMIWMMATGRWLDMSQWLERNNALIFHKRQRDGD
jgi:hypothetical protein